MVQLNSTYSVNESLQNKLENNLTFLGLAALEDQLCLKVTESLASLKAAKIKTWILSGDAQENIVSVGRSVGLIPPEQKQVLTFNENHNLFLKKKM